MSEESAARRLAPIEAPEALPTGARPAYDLTELLRLAARPFAEAEAGYEALYARIPDQYQARDWRTHHYDLTWIAGLDWPVRGPVPALLQPRRYFVVIGGAVGFGARADRPFGRRLAEQTGLACLNLSRAGLSPAAALAAAGGLMPWCREAAFLVVEAMPVPGLPAADAEAEAAAGAVWEEAMRDFLDLAGRPAMLLSLRAPGPAEPARGDPGFDRLDRLAARAEPVFCMTGGGLPSRAVNRFTGARDRFRHQDAATDAVFPGGPLQSAYPSDAMHAAAAAALAASATVRTALRGRGGLRDGGARPAG